MRLLVLISAFIIPSSQGLAVLKREESVSALLQQYSKDIQALQSSATNVDSNPVFLLRYCLEYDDAKERLQKFQDTMTWRQGAGNSICQAAKTAIQQATADKGVWKNQPVLDAAPHAALVQKYLVNNVLTTTAKSGDLVYCVRAGQINDQNLMAEVSVDQMVEFFLYAKEVNALVANQRSLESDKLVTIITANDLSGIKLIGGSSDFRQALSISSKQANDLYPATAGPTLLLNLPLLVNALVKLFTPLFPPAVNERLRFASGPVIKRVSSLTEIAPGGAERQAFLEELEEIVVR